MSIDHHLDDASVIRYASGDLDAAFAVVVATHLALCGQCRAAVRKAEAAGGHLLETGTVTPLSDDLLDRLMAKIDEDGVGESVSPAPAQRDVGDDVPLPLQPYIGSKLSGIKWRRVVPGVRKSMLKPLGDTGSALYLLYIAPGVAMPEHGHGGTEMTLVLSGAYRDAFGVFGPGDIADLDEHVEHQPKVEPGAPCICLVATEEPTRFKDIVSRIFQPFLGI